MRTRHRKHRRDPPSRRELTIALGRRAIEAIYDPHEKRETASLVFEDALRELDEQAIAFADAIAANRGRYEEGVFIRQAFVYLENLPRLERIQRVTRRVEGILSRAWQRKIITRADEVAMPILTHLDRWIARALQITDSTYGRYINPKKEVRRLISEGFRLTGISARPYSPPAQHRLAQRVADAIYEEAQS